MRLILASHLLTINFRVSSWLSIKQAVLTDSMCSLLVPKHCLILKASSLNKGKVDSIRRMDRWTPAHVREISNKIKAGMNILVQQLTEMHRWKAYINISMQKNKGNKQRYCVRVFKVFEVLYFRVLLWGVTLNTPVMLQMWALCNTCQALAATSWGNKSIRLYSNLQRILWRLMSE